MIASFVRQWSVCPEKAEIISRNNNNNNLSVALRVKQEYTPNGASIEEQGEQLWEKL